MYVLLFPVFQLKFDDLQSDSQESYQGEELPASLCRKLKEDAIFYFSFSTKELQLVVDLETSRLEDQVMCSESKANLCQGKCRQELERRVGMKETTQLLQIFRKMLK